MLHISDSDLRDCRFLWFLLGGPCRRVKVGGESTVCKSNRCCVFGFFLAEGR